MAPAVRAEQGETYGNLIYPASPLYQLMHSAMLFTTAQPHPFPPIYTKHPFNARKAPIKRVFIRCHNKTLPSVMPARAGEERPHGPAFLPRSARSQRTPPVFYTSICCGDIPDYTAPAISYLIARLDVRQKPMLIQAFLSWARMQCLNKRIILM